MTPDAPRDDGPVDVVARWQDALRRRVGMGAAEARAQHAALTAFCARHGTDPVTLLATWTTFPQLTVRRRPDAVEPPDRAVESFLIHNGVNVFGDLVCVATRPADLAGQGRQFATGG